MADIPITITQQAQQDLSRLSRWIDSHNRQKSEREQLWERTAKCAEETGEVIGAMIGVTGQNPRKGFTHTIDDVEAELLDVAVTALGAIEHIHGNEGVAFDRLFTKLRMLTIRREKHGG